MLHVKATKAAVKLLEMFEKISMVTQSVWLFNLSLIFKEIYK